MNLAHLPAARPLLPGEDAHRAADLARTITTGIDDSAEALGFNLELLAGAADLTPAAEAVAVELQATMHRAVELSRLLRLTTAG